VVSTITTLVYLAYRATTWAWQSWDDEILSVALWAAEALGGFQLLVTYRLLARELRAPSWPEMPKDVHQWPTVAIFIPTVNEPVSVLRRTIVGCVVQDYPADRRQIYVLDDGHRLVVQDLAEEYGVQYLARPTHEEAKAGNLNWALAHTSSDIVVLFDADMVPKPWAVTALVRPLMADPTCAFAQAPQAFYNPDPFQHNLGVAQAIPNEQDFFMRRLQAARARFNAVLFVGSNAAFRRHALETIGGFPTGTLTEDAATSLLLQAQGWRSVFVPDVVAQGLSAESWGEFLRQRDRWCRGNLQVAHKWPPWRLPGLTGMQRLIYVSGVLYWYFGIQKMVYLIAPLAFLDLGVWSVHATVPKMLAVWLPSFVSQQATFRRIARGTRSVWWSHVYEVAQAPALAWSALTETLGLRHLRFHVTAKAVQSNRIQVVWSTMIVWVVLLSASVYGLVRGLSFMASHAAVWDWVALASGWTLYNMVAILAAMAVSVNQPRWRAAERFVVNRPSHIRHARQTEPVTIVDVSEGGSRLQGSCPWPVGTAIEVFLDGLWLPAVILAETSADLRVAWGSLTRDEYLVIWRWTYGQPVPFVVMEHLGLWGAFQSWVRRWAHRLRTRRSSSPPSIPGSITRSGTSA